MQNYSLYESATSCSPTARVEGFGQINYTVATKERKTFSSTYMQTEFLQSVHGPHCTLPFIAEMH